MRTHSPVRVLAAAALAVALVSQAANAQADLPDLTADLATALEVVASPGVTSAFAYLERAKAESVQEWLSLCNASGPSGSEGARSRLLYKLFRIYGLTEVRIDDAFNVIGVRKGEGEGPTVVLNAHHDNVALWPADQPVEAFVADGRVWCPAAADDLMGVTQMLTVLRALNAADIRTAGDIWFVGLTGEEAPDGPSHPDASPGAEQLVRANYPHNLDWRNGDILVQFHGGGGEGVATGSTPVRNRSILRVFGPFDNGLRWGPHGVDALAGIISRVGPEVRDPRGSPVPFESAYSGDLPEDVLFMNMGKIGASEIIGRPGSETWVRFDMRAATQARMDVAHAAIRDIAEEVTGEMGEGYSYVYEINSRNGVEGGIPGFDNVDNAAARMAAAAAVALYGGAPVIDGDNGCGDCVRAYKTGMPAFSLRGGVVDRGDGQVARDASRALQSDVRRRRRISFSRAVRSTYAPRGRA